MGDKPKLLISITRRPSLSASPQLINGGGWGGGHKGGEEEEELEDDEEETRAKTERQIAR